MDSIQAFGEEKMGIGIPQQGEIAKLPKLPNPNIIIGSACPASGFLAFVCVYGQHLI